MGLNIEHTELDRIKIAISGVIDAVEWRGCSDVEVFHDPAMDQIRYRVALLMPRQRLEGKFPAVTMGGEQYWVEGDILYPHLAWPNDRLGVMHVTKASVRSKDREAMLKPILTARTQCETDTPVGRDAIEAHDDWRYLRYKAGQRNTSEEWQEPFIMGWRSCLKHPPLPETAPESIAEEASRIFRERVGGVWTYDEAMR